MQCTQNTVAPFKCEKANCGQNTKNKVRKWHISKCPKNGRYGGGSYAGLLNAPDSYSKLSSSTPNA